MYVYMCVSECVHLKGCCSPDYYIIITDKEADLPLMTGVGWDVELVW